MELRKKIKPNPKQVGEDEKINAANRRIKITLQNADGELLGTILDIPVLTSVTELQQIVNKLNENKEVQLYSFFYEEKEIKTNLNDFIQKLDKYTTETILPITYHPQSLFFVRPITRQSSSLPGHTEAVLHAQFSPDGQQLASGSGDTTVRFWDVTTELPKIVCENGHKNWVLIISWSPCGRYLASGSMDGQILLWDKDGKKIGDGLIGHQKWITAISWEPLHQNGECELLSSSSKDETIRIWHRPTQKTLVILSGHLKCVTKVVWGGQGYLYSCSQDQTVKVWEKSGKLIKDLQGHGHWVNSIAIHTDYVNRTGCYDENYNGESWTSQVMQQKALERYNKLKGKGNERVVSASDDNTLMLWDPVSSKKTNIQINRSPAAHQSCAVFSRWQIYNFGFI
eukprot:TRINITY_DN2005_c0_g1_i1.p1 TRINITY_DN2005_c0_g1~~TRINITY_DN2005_c0_g1_i1.p1  ORF type:complete len:398 (+),score=64.50 TRINITY_DN2005_c0_g1_i1:334-1527(+)